MGSTGLFACDRMVWSNRFTRHVKALHPAVQGFSVFKWLPGRGFEPIAGESGRVHETFYSITPTHRGPLYQLSYPVILSGSQAIGIVALPGSDGTVTVEASGVVTAPITI